MVYGDTTCLLRITWSQAQKKEDCGGYMTKKGFQLHLKHEFELEHGLARCKIMV